MTATGRRPPADPLRDLRLRRGHAVIVLLAVAHTLHHTDPRPVKVRRTAEYLRLDPRRVRRALDTLVHTGYLVRAIPATTRHPGHYCLGPLMGAGADPIAFTTDCTSTHPTASSTP
jgi:hypothetical protein